MSSTPLIAVINDDPAFLEFIAVFLEEEANCRTVVWDDGVDSLPKLREHKPALVILDVRLGDQAVGHQILHSMRNEADLAGTPVIICTADTNFIRENRGVVELLEAEVMEKPFDLEELEARVRMALGGQLVPSGDADPTS